MGVKLRRNPLTKEACVLCVLLIHTHTQAGLDGVIYEELKKLADF